MSEEIILVLTTFADAETAREVVQTLVSEKLVACGNVLPGIKSIYRWKGEIETASEALCIFKTHRDLYARLEARLKALHPYEVPECLAVPVEAGLEAYRLWVAEALR